MVSASSPEDEESPEEEPSFPGLDKWCIVARESWERRSVGWRSVRGQEGQGESQVGDWGGPVRVVPTNEKHTDEVEYTGHYQWTCTGWPQVQHREAWSIRVTCTENAKVSVCSLS